MKGKDIIYDELLCSRYKKRINYIKKFISDLTKEVGQNPQM